MKHRERITRTLAALAASVGLIAGPLAGVAYAQTPSLTDGTNTLTGTGSTSSSSTTGAGTTGSTAETGGNTGTGTSTESAATTSNASNTGAANTASTTSGDTSTTSNASTTVNNTSNTTNAANDSSTGDNGSNSASTNTTSSNESTTGSASLFAAATATTTATSSAPVISGIAATPGQTSAVIMWTTDMPSDTLVNYGTSAFYGASTTLQASTTTNHVQTLFGLAPNTTYHFQVVSNASGAVATSTDQTFTTLAAAAPAPTISGISVSPTDTTAQISWTTNQPASGQVRYGTTTASYFASTTLDSGLMTNHVQTLTGLTPNQAYHFQVLSANGSSTLATSSDQMFMTASSSGTATSTATSTAEELRTLRDRISALEELIRTLTARIEALIGMISSGNNGGNNGGGTGTTTPPVAGRAHIDQNGRHVNLGSTIDFGGHGFLSEEDVSVTMNGSQIATAHADNQGNFSTGSLSVPGVPGTYTYVFTGDRGDSASATIVVKS